MKLAVVSGKGGTGKSSITASFISLAKKVIAIDCDVDASNLYLIYDCQVEETEHFTSGYTAYIDKERCVSCAKCYDSCHFNAIENIRGGFTVNEIVCEGCGICEYICPNDAVKMIKSDGSIMYSGKFRYGHMFYGRLAPGEENSGKFIDVIRARADDFYDKSREYEHIIIDGPPGIGCPVISTLSGMEKVVIVTEPTMSGFSDLKRIYEVAANFTKSIFIIINKCDIGGNYGIVIEEWCKEKNINIAGKIPFDKIMVQAMINKQSITEYAPENKCSYEIKKAFKKLFF